MKAEDAMIIRTAILAARRDAKQMMMCAPAGELAERTYWREYMKYVKPSGLGWAYDTAKLDKITRTR